MIKHTKNAILDDAKKRDNVYKAAKEKVQEKERLDRTF